VSETTAPVNVDSLVRAAPIGIAILDRDLRYQYVNEHLAAINGFTVEESIGRTLEETLGDLAATIGPLLRDVMETGKPMRVRSAGRLPADPGRLRHFESHNHALKDDAGVTTGVAAYVVEITGQVEAEAERDRVLAELEARTRNELERNRIQLEQAQGIAQLGSWEANMQTGEVVWSRELRRMYGVNEEFVASYESWLALVHPDDRPRVEELTGQSIRSGEPVDYEYRLIRPNGDVRVISGRNRTVGAVTGRPERLLGTSQDITDHKAMEARLLITDRMAALGTLAAGLAHEINNPLAYALGNVDLALENLSALSQRIDELPVPASVRDSLAAQVATQRELLRVVAEGGGRVRTIVRDMKVFARGETEQDAHIDVRAVVESAATLASNEIRHRSRLRIAHGRTPPVRGSQSRLGQVVLNLLVNAAQAIPDGSPDDHEIHVGTFTDERGRAVLEVSDTGIGIAPEHLGRIFDPFFTTKPVGTGSGLGLSICHGIVQSLGGEITVDSAPGRGTRVRVNLPASDPVGASSPAPAPPPAHRRVLVIDDEPQVVAFSKRSLAGRCDVVGLTDAREALARITEGEQFDLILCDLMMPRMSGIDLYERVVAERPDLAGCFVFVTGGAFTQRAQEFIESEGRQRLDKPFTPAQLRTLVDARLNLMTATPTGPS
jgi:PAS domain S-box-containing protein